MSYVAYIAVICTCLHLLVWKHICRYIWERACVGLPQHARVYSYTKQLHFLSNSMLAKAPCLPLLNFSRLCRVTYIRTMHTLLQQGWPMRPCLATTHLDGRSRPCLRPLKDGRTLISPLPQGLSNFDLPFRRSVITPAYVGFAIERFPPRASFNVTLWWCPKVNKIGPPPQLESGLFQAAQNKAVASRLQCQLATFLHCDANLKMLL